jgi:hypothetical protein
MHKTATTEERQLRIKEQRQQLRLLLADPALDPSDVISSLYRALRQTTSDRGERNRARRPHWRNTRTAAR